MGMLSGKAFIALGIVLIFLGLYLCYGGRFDWLGRLPGDIRIEREGFRFYLPLGSCLLLSALISLLAWLFKR
jgi:hypothetical protein